jgi:hypothetical protein
MLVKKIGNFVMSVKLSLTSWGRSQWIFENELAQNDQHSSVCFIEHDSRGLKLISSSNYQPGNHLFTERSFLCLPYGEHRNRLCWNCVKYGHKKVKVSSEISNLYFCSLECLEESSQFLKICGKIISSLFTQSSTPSMNILEIFCIKILYLLEVEKQISLFDSIRRHELHLDIPLPEIDTMASNLFSLINENSPVLLASFSRPLPILTTILRCLHFNSQSHDIPDLPKTSYLCFYNHLSRINHSCNPNSILTFHISSNDATISSSVIATRHISVGEELTVSYLTQLCSSLRSRREFLKQGFQFHCECSRCLIEEKYFPNPLQLTSTGSESGIWYPTILKERLAESPYQSRSLSERLQFLEQIKPQLSLLEETLTEISSQWSSLCCTSTLSLVSTRQRFLKSFERVYEYHDLLLLLTDTLLSSASNKLVSATQEEQVSKDMLIIHMGRLLQIVWKLSADLSEFRVSPEDSILSRCSLTNVNILLVSGGAASRLVRLLLENAGPLDRTRVTQSIHEGREMVKAALGVVKIISTSPPGAESQGGMVSGFQGLLGRIEKLVSMLS